MFRNVITLSPGDTLAVAMRAVAQGGGHGPPGFAVVLDQMRLVGLLTEFDMLKWIVQGRDPHSKTLREMRLSAPVSVREETPIQELIDLYNQRRFRRFPVLNEDGVLSGGIMEKQILAALPRTSLLIQFQVADMISPPLPEVGPDVSYREAAKLMMGWHRGCVVVVADHVMVGIVTERDLIRLRMEPDWDPERPVSSFMSHSINYLTPETDLLKALDFFVETTHRRIPVAEADGSFRGLLTQTAVLNAMVQSARSHQAVLNPESIPEPALWFTPDDKHAILAINAMGGKLLQLNPEEWAGRSAEDLMEDPDVLDALHVLLRNCGHIDNLNLPVRTGAGNRLCVASSFSLVNTPSGGSRIFWSIGEETHCSAPKFGP
ncbi:putative signal-transduction protein [Magnetofaba australis IT-1]|uniref:Putative signal-transduction protein n=2 Tax=Magnetofaba TaxID=1472292 RepID=A0A1Y2K3M4_9PROT|nr:putative signal-transduction protein [Magnetofaba australis IT-1]